jgi:spore coat protein U-like protein
MRQVLKLALSAGLAASGFDPAIGATTTAALSVGMTVNATCAIEQVPVLDFGTRTLVLTSLDIAVAIGVRCTNGAPYTIAIDAGLGVAATTGLRRMTGPTQWGYSLFRDAARTQIWGDAASDVVSGAGTGNLVSHPVYARAYAQGMNPPLPGAYTDSVKITLTF